MKSVSNSDKWFKRRCVNDEGHLHVNDGNYTYNCITCQTPSCVLTKINSYHSKPMERTLFCSMHYSTSEQSGSC